MPDKTPPKSWRRFILPCSILLNLFFAAIIGGRLYATYARHWRGKTLWERVLTRVDATIPEREATAFKAIILRDEPRYKEGRRQLAAARAELLRQITADPYNREETERAFQAWKTAWNAFAGDFGGTVIEALGAVSPEGRRKLAAGHWPR